MDRSERVILTNMCMIYDYDKILVLDRQKGTWTGITFPGGHVEKNESFVKSTIREVKEETGLDIKNLRLCGIRQFVLKENDDRYIVLLFKTDKFCGELKSSDEGKVFWIRRSELNNYKLADGFDKIIEVFENENLAENYNYIDEVWKTENL